MPVLLTHEQKTDVVVDFSVTASAAAGTVFQGAIYQFGYSEGSVTLATIPATEVWHLSSMKVNISPIQTDAQVQYKQNGYVQDFQPTLGSLLAINNYTPYEFDETQVMYPTNTFSLNLTLLDAAPATAYTQHVILRFVRAPFTG